MTTVSRPNPLRRWTVAAGTFFFRYRNGLFPAVFASAAVVMRPRVMGTPLLDRWLGLCGLAVALTGELVRLATIGFEYIERGGKEGKVYASRLVQGGVYGLTRNPMYVGNTLIAIGVSMVSGAPIAYAVLVPLFLYIYLAIVLAEETYLRQRFGPAYDTYCASVNRFLPRWRNTPQAFTGMRYRWRRSIRQDLSTITALLLALAVLPLWRTLFLEGHAVALAHAPKTLLLVGLILAWYGGMHTLKKQSYLVDAPGVGRQKHVSGARVS